MIYCLQFVDFCHLWHLLNLRMLDVVCCLFNIIQIAPSTAEFNHREHLISRFAYSRTILYHIFFLDFTKGLWINSNSCLFQARLFNEINLELASERVLSQVYGLYCALNAVVILHVAIFVHHRPIISLGFWVLLLKLLFYVSQAFYFKTITSLPNLMFPLVSCLVR